MDFIWMIVIGMGAGRLAGQFMIGRGFGMAGDIVIGTIGALIGGLVFQETGMMSGIGFTGSMAFAAMGAIVFLYGVRWIKRA